MNEDRRGSVMKSFRTFCYILGMVLFAALVASWFVWGTFGAVFYVDGLFNSPWVFVLGPFLFLLIPVAVVCLPILAARTISRWSRLDDRERWSRALKTTALFAFVASFALGFTGLTPTCLDMFARGLSKFVDRRTDIEAIQSWLGTLDPNDCEGQPLEVRIAPGVNFPDPPKYIPTPAPVARLGHWGNRLSRDDAGRPMIRFFLGGGGLIGHWGLVVGHKDMAIPPSDPSDFGEQRFPLAPGAYIWSSD